MAANIILGIIVVVFIIVLNVMVIFVIVHCYNMYSIAQHWATAAEALIISSAVGQEGSPEGDAIHYFRLKNG